MKIMKKSFKIQLLWRKSIKLVRSLKSIFWTEFWGGKALISLASAILAYLIASILKIDSTFVWIAVFYFSMSGAILNLDNYDSESFREERFLRISQVVFDACVISIIASLLTTVVAIPLLIIGGNAMVLITGIIGLVLFMFLFFNNMAAVSSYDACVCCYEE